MTADALRIGFIPLIDAASTIIAADKGFAAAEGLNIELVREVSWSNVRDKLNLGLFDAAHLLSPVAVASSLGLGHIKVPVIAPFTLNLNGNAITVSPSLHDEIRGALDGDAMDPLRTAQALARVVAIRRKAGAEPVTFGMTFPYSTHNYQLRFWMAAGGVDPDEDVRLVVLPPPYMADSLAGGQVDGYCVGAPWNAVAVERGIGRILHFGPDILKRAVEKVLAVRQRWADDNPERLAALIRAHRAAAAFIEDPDHHDEVAAILARPDRVNVSAALIKAVLAGRLTMMTGGDVRVSPDYMLFGREGADRPDPSQALWLYAQMVRWKQTVLSPHGIAVARATFRPDLYDAALGQSAPQPSGGVGAFAGPALVGDDVAAYLDGF